MTRTERAHERLKAGPACGWDLVDAGVGYRYSARINDLRNRGVEVWSIGVCKRHDHESPMVEYRLADQDQMELW